MEWMPTSMWDIWESGDFSGDNRPYARVTIQKSVLKWSNGFRTQLFNQTAQQVEIPQAIIKGITIDRRLGEAAAQMTMTLINQLPLSSVLNLDQSHAAAAGQTPALPTRRTLQDLQSPGFYSFRRGMQASAQDRWAHNVSSTWQDMFIPNRVVRTWQGYGTDGASRPWNDSRLIQTGTWLIDRVTYNADGTIQIVCRDMAKLLIEQRLYPPIVPQRLYPLEICKEHWERWSETIVTQSELYSLGPDVGGHKASGYDSSVALPGVLSWNASVYGHRASDAFDNNATTYWLSEGYYDRNEKSPFLASDTRGEPVNFVRCQMKLGGYGTGYVAVKVNGAWVGINGTQLIPGTTSGNLNAANQMSYVALAPINTGDGDWWECDLGATYNAEEVRVYVRGLADSGLVPPYRAAIAEMEVRLRTANQNVPTAPTGSNLVPDGTFEDGVGGWVKARNPVTLAEFDPGSTLSIYTLDFYEGTQSLRVNPDNLFAGAQRELPNSVQPGDRIRVTVRVVSGGPEDKFRLVIRGLDNTSEGGTLIAASSPAETAANNDWVALTAEGVIPAGHTGFLIRLSVVSTTDPVGVGPFNIDAVTAYKVEGGTTVTTIDHIDYITGISDYTEIVKVFAAWAGFYWPDGGPDDPVLAKFSGDQTSTGRVWGDFFYSGAYPVDPMCIPADYWDNKSVMDGINQIKEILGFICYVDASGGLVWRMPNIWRTGNFIVGYGYAGNVPEIDEEKVLLDYGVAVDDAGLRSQIIVVSSDDPTLYTAIEPGYVVNPNELESGGIAPETMVGDKALLGGQKRVALVPNFPFVSQEEVDKFAYLVALWMHWSYRKGRVRVPGNPAFQPDDQVRIWERTTAESFVHYIHGVSSVMDCQKGTWHLDLDTQWLGDGPSDTWLVNTYVDMPPALFAYLQSIGEIPTDVDPSQVPDMTGYVPPADIVTDVWDRVNDDFSGLFPEAPTIIYGSDDSWSEEDIAINYGNGETEAGVQHRSERWRYEEYGPPGSGLVTINFVEAWNSIYLTNPSWAPANTWSGQTLARRIQVPAVLADAYRMLGQVFCEFEYYIGVDTGAFAGTDRVIAGTNILSSHAWGLAIDVNWQSNPYCSMAKECYTGAGISSLFRQAAEFAVQNIVTKNSRTRVFGWGGYWNSAKDWMHFEVVCPRANAEEGFKFL